MPLIIAHFIRVPAFIKLLPPILSLIPNKAQLELSTHLERFPLIIEPAKTLIVS